MYSPTIQKLIDLFSKFPTVGPRTAARFVFHLMHKPKEEIEELITSISNLKTNIKICPLCLNPYESEAELCSVCSDSRRDKSLLCIVSNETDLMTIEKTKKYQGLYFILGGTVSRLKKADIEKLKVKELEKRIKNGREIKEIILALNPTAEGEATTLYLERLIKNLPVFKGRVTRLGRGLPLGGELEYADEETLSSALESRK
jgi:recombination protein RecR